MFLSQSHCACATFSSLSFALLPSPLRDEKVGEKFLQFANLLVGPKCTRLTRPLFAAPLQPQHELSLEVLSTGWLRERTNDDDVRERRELGNFRWGVHIGSENGENKRRGKKVCQRRICSRRLDLHNAKLLSVDSALLAGLEKHTEQMNTGRRISRHPARQFPLHWHLQPPSQSNEHSEFDYCAEKNIRAEESARRR